MMLFSAIVAAAGTRRGLLQLLRPYSSALNGNRTPIDNVTKNTAAMLHQEEDSSRSTEEAFELRVPGVVGQVEPNVPKAGTVDIPNPSAAALEKQPIAKVTVDGDVTANSIPSPPGESQPRN